MSQISRITRVVAGMAPVLLFALAFTTADPQGGGPGTLKTGTVTANVDGSAFSANVSIATFAEGKLVLSNLSNLVQLQVPKAKVGKFELKLDADGGLVDQILSLKAGNRFVTPVSGWITIESLTATSATGRFEFSGKDIATEAPVKVTDGRFDVKFTGK